MLLTENSIKSFHLSHFTIKPRSVRVFFVRCCDAPYYGKLTLEKQTNVVLWWEAKNKPRRNISSRHNKIEHHISIVRRKSRHVKRQQEKHTKKEFSLVQWICGCWKQIERKITQTMKIISRMKFRIVKWYGINRRSFWTPTQPRVIEPNSAWTNRFHDVYTMLQNVWIRFSCFFFLVGSIFFDKFAQF